MYRLLLELENNIYEKMRMGENECDLSIQVIYRFR